MNRSEGDIVADRYRLLVIVGRGGFGVVWKAYDSVSGSLVALKFLHHPSAELDRRFAVEAQALSRINNPYCLRPIDFGHDGGSDFLVTDFVEGLSLVDWLATPKSLLDRTKVACGIAAGLVAAHREGVVHRDLKPANIIINASDGEPAIIDFGIAKLLGQHQPDITKTGEVLGTPGFMSPEQLRGRKEIGAPTDMYAFGALLYQMLEGRPPFVGDSAIATAMQHLTEPAPAVRQPDAVQFAPLVAQLLDKDPARRPTAVVVEATLAGSARRSPPPDEPRSGRRVVVIVGAVGVLALGALAVVGTRGDENPEPVARQRSPDVTSLLKQDSTAPDPPAAPIVEAGDMSRDTGRDVGVTSPCRDLRQLRPGIRPLHTDAGDVWVRIPPRYDPARPLPVVIMFHDGLQSPERALESPRFSALGADEQWLMIAPEGDPLAERDHWRDEALHDSVLLQVASAMKLLCVDEQRIYTLGFGHGGLAAFRFARDIPVAAIATFAYRPSKWRSPGEVEKPTLPKGSAPVLAISVTEDPLQPFDGGPGCTNNEQISAAEFHAMLHQALDCADAPAEVRPKTGCETVTCRAPLKTCVVEGGRMWPTGQSYGPFVKLIGSFKNCPDGKRPAGITRMIWDFFVTAPPLEL